MKHLKSEQGMTLVSILTAFTMLVLILAVFSVGLSVSSNIQHSAADGQSSFSALQEQYYLREGKAQMTASDITVNFVSENGESISLTVTQEVLTDENGNELRYFK